jgi:hypothetical protein
MNGNDGDFTVGSTGVILTGSGFGGYGEIGGGYYYGGAMMLLNQGLISSQTAGQTLTVNSSCLTNSGTLQAINGATLVLSNDGGTTNNATGLLKAWNGGVLQIEGAGGPFVNAGTVCVASATVAFANGFTQTGGQTVLVGGGISGDPLDFNGGSLVGSGTISADITMNSGSTLAPGQGFSAPQTLTAQGNVTFNPGSTYQVRIATDGSFDRIRVAGNATLDGAVSFIIGDGYTPSYYDTYDIVEVGGTRTGTFGLTDGEEVGDGLTVSFEGGNGEDMELTGGVPVGAAPIGTASPTQPAYIDCDYSSANNGTTYTFQSLTVEPGDTATLGPEDTLVLTDGPLVVAPGAIFTGDGTVDGNVINEGLVRIPIVKLNELSEFSFGTVEVSSSGVAPVYASFTVNPDTIVSFGGDGGGGGGFGGGGGGAAGGGGGGGGGIIEASATNSGVFIPVGYYANLEITGTYTQTDTGALRLFIGGNQKGVTYSHLTVDSPVSLSGKIELVLEPDLFNFLPSVGETFDLIDCPAGITIPDSLTLLNFITQTGASYVPGLTLTPYNSGIEGDPDQLDQIQEPIFAYSIVDNGTELEATLVEPVPEPKSWMLLIGFAIPILALPLQRRKKNLKGVFVNSLSK